MNILQKVKTHHKGKLTAYIVLFVAACFGIVQLGTAWAENSQPDPITKNNETINTNEQTMKANSTAYNNLDKKNAELMFEYTGNQAKMSGYNATNESLRTENEKLRNDNNNIILGK